MKREDWFSMREPVIKGYRKVRILRLLEINPDGLRLRELVLADGRTDRNGQAAMATMLLKLRQEDYVIRLASVSPASGPGGQYKITPAGAAYLAVQLAMRPDWEGEPWERAVETGAMRGEHPTVIVRTVEMAPDNSRSGPSTPYWVFDAAHLHGAGSG